MMRHAELERLWRDTEDSARMQRTEEVSMRLIGPELAFRTYIGTEGGPYGRRLLCIDIPVSGQAGLTGLSPSRGFALRIGAPFVEREGHAGCWLQAADISLNDVFSVVAEDVLGELDRCRDGGRFLEVLTARLGKWQDFFSSRRQHRLTQEAVRGLIGEMEFLHALAASGVTEAAGLWAGPLGRRQDFMCGGVAAEVKTTAGDAQAVRISSEEQLDGGELQALYLLVYGIRPDDERGRTLQEFIAAAEEELDEGGRCHLRAKIACLGYQSDDPAWNSRRYIIAERCAFAVREGFPCLRRADLPAGVSHVSYRLALGACADFASETDEVITALKEAEHVSA